MRTTHAKEHIVKLKECVKEALLIVENGIPLTKLLSKNVPFLFIKRAMPQPFIHISLTNQTFNKMVTVSFMCDKWRWFLFCFVVFLE